MLADIGGDEGIAMGNLVERLDDGLRLDDAAVALVVREQPTVTTPLVDLLPPGSLGILVRVSPISLTIATISVRTLSTGPTIGMSALMVLEIDAGSMSMWMILAFGQNFAAPLMTRSSKRAPTARITSL